MTDSFSFCLCLLNLFFLLRLHLAQFDENPGYPVDFKYEEGECAAKPVKADSAFCEFDKLLFKIQNHHGRHCTHKQNINKCGETRQKTGSDVQCHGSVNSRSGHHVAAGSLSPYQAPKSKNTTVQNICNG